MTTEMAVKVRIHERHHQQVEDHQLHLLGLDLLPRYSGVRPTISPAMNTASMAMMSIPYSPDPVPPGLISPSIMLKRITPPPSGV